MTNIIKASSLAIALCAGMSTHAAEFTFSSNINKDAQTLVVFYSQDGKNKQFKALNKEFKQHLQRVIDIENFKGDYASVAELIAPQNSKYDRILVVGTGKQKELDKARITKLGGNIHARLLGNKVTTASVIFDDVTLSLIHI